MATRFYLPYAQSATPFSRDTSTEWRTFIGTRSMSSDVPQADTLTTKIHSGDDGGSGVAMEGPDGLWHTYVLYKQYVSPPLAAQTIPAATPWRLQCQIDKMTTASAYATDLHYVRFRGYLVGENNSGVYSAYSGESTAEANNNEVMENRTVTGNTSTARTITSGARLVLEVGVHSVYAAQPYSVAQHAMRFGYNVAGWLPSADNVSISTTLSPWWELDHNLLFQRELSAATGSFSLEGQAPRLWANKVNADVVAFGVSGKDAALTRTRLLAADAGSFSLTGQDAAFIVGKTVGADVGSFTLAGQASGLLATRVIVPDAAAYVLAGQDVGLNHGFAAEMGVGEFVLAGQDAGFVVGKGVAADTGIFVVNGKDATLAYSGTPPVTGNGTQCDTLAWLMIDEPGGSW